MLNMKRTQILFLLCLVLSFTFSIFAQDKDTKEVTILRTSDVHSRIKPVNQRGDECYNESGFLRRAVLLEQFRKKHKNVLLFDCGGTSQGIPYYNVLRGEMGVELMSEIGYNVMTISNYEFDFGVDSMKRIFKMANSPITRTDYNLDIMVLKDMIKHHIILRKYGLRAGVFGLGTRSEGMIQASKCEGVVYKDPTRVSNEIAALLKDGGGCDLIVRLSHLDIQMDRHPVAGTHNIDVILGGYSHTFVRDPETYLNMDEKEMPIIHMGKNGVCVGRLDLTLKCK